jgi:hypothetical protein
VELDRARSVAAWCVGAEVEVLRTGRERLIREAHQARAERDALRAEVETVRREAERAVYVAERLREQLREALACTFEARSRTQATGS